MKKIYLLLSIAILISACSGGKKESGQQNEPNGDETNFTLTGKFSNSDQNGKLIYLQSFDDKAEKYATLDSATITNDAFTFKGQVDNSSILRYISGESLKKPVLLFTEQGSVDIAFDSSLTPKIKGTGLNEKYQEYLDKRASYQKEMEELSKLEKKAVADKKMTPEYEAELESKYNTVYNRSIAYTFDFAKENIENAAGQYVFLDRGRSFNLDQLKEIMPDISVKSKESPKYTKIEKRFEALKITEIGNHFVDLKGKTPDDKNISLSDFAGKDKYVLIDFWASWCPPCRKEMPEVVKIYNEYKNKGFEIVGVSLDNDKTAWKNGIRNLKITWPQMSDLKQWDSELSAAYGVNSIPHMVLLDKEGKIIAKGFNARDLSNKLAELIK